MWAADGRKADVRPADVAERNECSDLLFVHVGDEVLLALQLDREVGCCDVLERALLGLLYLALFHVLNFLYYRVTRRLDYVI